MTVPNWVDTSVPEQRMHLRLYYSDMLAAKPVSPPVAADCDTWEVTAMRCKMNLQLPGKAAQCEGR